MTEQTAARMNALLSEENVHWYPVEHFEAAIRSAA